MGCTAKHQATYDFMHGRSIPSWLLRTVRKYFNRCNFPKHDYSRRLWYRHRNRKERNNETEN